MRLCYICINTEESSRPYLSLVEKVFRKVKRADTEIGIKGVKPGLDRFFPISSSYFDLLNKKEIVEKVIEAEREGYEAAIVGCFLDPGVREAREVVNIPVFGVAEPTLLFAHLLGRRFAVVTVSDEKIVWDIEDEIRLYGLRDRAIPKAVRPISIPVMEVATKGMQEPKIVALDILERAKECVAEGAEVVVVGCNGLGPLCTVSDVVEVPEVHAPILDCVAVTIKMAEALVELKNKLDMPFISRAGIYALPREKDLKRVRAIFGLKTD